MNIWDWDIKAYLVFLEIKESTETYLIWFLSSKHYNKVDSLLEIMVEYMKNMDKGLTVPKWVLIVWPKIPQMPQNLSAQFVYPSPKVLDFNEKRLHWVSVVRDLIYSNNQLFRPGERSFYYVLCICSKSLTLKCDHSSFWCIRWNIFFSKNCFLFISCFFVFTRFIQSAI